MTGGASRPRFSIVTAVYDVEPYLPDFVRSIERQRVAPGDLEVIAVDDGSTDSSLDLLREWAGRSRFPVKVFTKPNGGQGSARNLGLEHATGEWVTFPDPDDLLEPDYLRAAARFAAAHTDIAVMSARPILLNDATGALSVRHPRRWQYLDGNRVADLIEEPSVFLGLSSGSFFLLDRIRDAALAFDTGIRPNFEDAHFAVRYILGLRRPQIGLLHDASYVYRKRSAGTSTLQGSMRHPGRYSVVLERGYLDVLERGRRSDGSVPAWIQQLIVYELSWYLSEDERITSSVILPSDLAPSFHALLDRILRQLEPEVVARHRARHLRGAWGDILAHAGRGTDWHARYVLRGRLDATMGLRHLSYRFVGAQPSESIVADGSSTQPAFAKTRAHRYYDRDLLYERILWIPDAAQVSVSLGGQTVDIVDSAPGAQPPARRTPLRDRLWLARRRPRRVADALLRRARRASRPWRALPIRLAASSWPWRRRFREAWVLMDRIHDADDNGERLFEHLRRERPDINAWFVIERDSPDWHRLRSSGERRIVAHGSLTWQLLMLNCRWLLSSHADAPIARPPQVMRITRPRWRFGFLQHGVIKDDLSRWLNQRQLELFVVSTDAELLSVAGDGTTYRFTTKETRNAGLPRFDRLLEVGASVPEAERDLVIVAPTWRQWLTLPLASGSQRRELDAAFWDSEYIRTWDTLLRSRTIAAAVAARGWRLGFMPHPNLQSILGQMDLPDHVQQLSFAGTDVQALYGRCALLVTDYSSVAFNAAYLDRPVVYFQFDREAMFGGAHVGRQGYFDYGRDGFGPVVEDVAGAERAIVAAIERGPSPTPEYLERIRATFPLRDGHGCARVVAAVEELSRPYGAASG